MSPMFEPGPLLALAGLGAFHGLNPAMGWLFAVALGLQRQRRHIIWMSLLPIALGHALSVTVVLTAVVLFLQVLQPAWMEPGVGVVLLCWAAWHWKYGHRQRVRIGLKTGMAGLVLWSFLMATAHGAGPMLVPVVLPLCSAVSPAAELTGSGSVAVGLAAVGVHTGAMLAVTGAIAATVYEWLGLAFLRRGWINMDLVWIGALAAAGLILVL
jgi:hypothetical protein